MAFSPVTRSLSNEQNKNQNRFLPIWIADAHRDDGKRFVAHADEKLSSTKTAEGVGLLPTNRKTLKINGRFRRYV
jgi:hypothetical protein